MLRVTPDYPVDQVLPGNVENLGHPDVPDLAELRENGEWMVKMQWVKKVILEHLERQEDLVPREILDYLVEMVIPE